MIRKLIFNMFVDILNRLLIYDSELETGLILLKHKSIGFRKSENK